MAQTVHLTLQIAGSQVEGESRIASMDRENTIECSAFTYNLDAPWDPPTGKLTGRRQHGPVTITKRIDRSTPLLLKALCENEPVTEAKFRFFRPAVSGAGNEEQFYTVILEDGFVSSVQQVSRDTIVGGEKAPPMMEEVSFVFQRITWTYEIGGATHTDSLRSR